MIFYYLIYKFMKDNVDERLDDIEKKIRILTKRLDEIQESSLNNITLERRIAKIEKTLEKSSKTDIKTDLSDKNGSKVKDYEKEFQNKPINKKNDLETNDFKPNGSKTKEYDYKINKPKDYDLSDYKAKNKAKEFDPNDYKISNKTKEYEQNDYKINSKPNEYEEFKLHTRLYEDMSKEPTKTVSESKKRSNTDYTKALDDLKGSRDMKERLEKREKFEKNEKEERREKYEKYEKAEKSEKTERSKNFLESEDFLKNESKYSKMFNKINTERPYLLESSGNNNNNVLKENKQNNSRTYNNNIQYTEDLGMKNPPNKHSKTHSFYLNQEEEIPRERKKSQNSIENLEKQEKRKKIDEGT